MSDCAAELRKGIIARLKAVTGVTTLLASGASSVYGAVSQNAAFPYVAVQNITAMPFNTKDKLGQEVKFQIHCYSQEKGYEAVDKIAAAVCTALQRQESNITVTGYTVVLIDFASRDSFMEPSSPATDSFYHAIVIFSGILQES